MERMQWTHSLCAPLKLPPDIPAKTVLLYTQACPCDDTSDILNPTDLPPGFSFFVLKFVRKPQKSWNVNLPKVGTFPHIPIRPLSYPTKCTNNPFLSPHLVPSLSSPVPCCLSWMVGLSAAKPFEPRSQQPQASFCTKVADTSQGEAGEGWGCLGST